MVTASNVHIVDATGQPMGKWPDIALLKEISDTLKTILTEDREWRAECKKEKEELLKERDQTIKNLRESFGSLNRTISPLEELNKTFGKLSGAYDEERDEFLRNIKRKEGDLN